MPTANQLKTFLAFAIVVVSIVGFSFWPHLYKGFFYQAIALDYVLCGLLFVMLTKKGSGLWRILFMFLFLAINNLLDELFFNPTKFELNEYIIAFAIIIHQSYFYVRSQRRIRRGVN